MTQAGQKILKMLETVDPTDTDTLDEIDARFCLYKHYSYHGYRGFTVTHTNRKQIRVYLSDDGTESCVLYDIYSRSRDALKLARPDGWEYSSRGKGHARLLSPKDGLKTRVAKHAELLPTEELAEMHAIVQAWEWERDNE